MMSGKDVEREIQNHKRTLEAMGKFAEAEAEFIRKKNDRELRDWFAGQVLANPGIPGEPEHVAVWAYRYADAMMAERARRDGDGQE